MSQIILGIDPGSRKTGYGVIQMVNNEPVYLGSGCIMTGSDALYKRLLIILDGVNNIIEQFHPDEMAIEETFLSQNVQATIKLSEARAVAMVAGASAGLEVFEYTPMQIKQAVVGYGAAQKTQVQYMVKSLLKLNGTPQADAADALACAICHGFASKINRILGPNNTIATSSRGRKVSSHSRNSWRSYTPPQQ